MAIDWKTKYARRNDRMSRSLIREMLKQSTRPGVISLAGGLPAPELFPLELCEEASQRVLHSMGGVALQYGETEGYLPLREFICDQMSRYGIKTKPLNVVITQGSQQGLDLVGKVMIDPDDRVIVEAPSYLGALQAFTAYEVDFVSVPMDEDGIRTDLLAQQISKMPKFMYILPNFQNPSGTTLSLKRRKEVIEISNTYGIPILEDDPYGALRFEGEHLPSLMVLDNEYQKVNGNGRHGFDAGNVIYLGTYSKTLAPGLRLGWVVAPDNILNQLVIAKQGADLHSTMFTQALVYEMIKDGFLDEHIPIIRRVYRERRDIMLENLVRYFPEECTWTKPQGGLFLWVTVPEWLDLVALLEVAIEFKVVYVPGIAFYADPSRGKNTMRLNFSNSQPEQIEEGIKRLGHMLKKVMVKI